jgi:hypothetical protein
VSVFPAIVAVLIITREETHERTVPFRQPGSHIDRGSTDVEPPRLTLARWSSETGAERAGGDDAGESLL